MTADLARSGIFSPQRLDDRAVDEFLGLCRGVLFDGDVHEKEVVRLEAWCAQHRAAFAQWPLDVVATRITAILEDGLVEETERSSLATLLQELLGAAPEDADNATALPLTAPPPTVVFPERVFLFTGTFAFGSRKACESAVTIRKGRCTSTVCSGVSYVVIGSRATKAWMHSSYGRKIEAAVELVRNGAGLNLVSEEHWTRALGLVQAYDPDLVRSTLLDAIRAGQCVEFLYRGSQRVVRPERFVTWYGQPAIEGTYLSGQSVDPEQGTRQYILHHIAEIRLALPGS